MSSGLNMGNSKHRAFVDRLVNDAATRAAFEKDPVGTLHQYGIGHDPANPPTPGTLPSPEVIAGQRDRMVTAMNDSDGWDIMHSPSFNSTSR